MCIWIHIFGKPAGKIIHHIYLYMPTNERIDDMGSDKPRSSGHQGCFIFLRHRKNESPRSKLHGMSKLNHDRKTRAESSGLTPRNIHAKTDMVSTTTPTRTRHSNGGMKKSSYKVRNAFFVILPVIHWFSCFQKMNHKGCDPIFGSRACFTMIGRVFITLSSLKNGKIFTGGFTCFKRRSSDEVSLG